MSKLVTIYGGSGFVGRYVAQAMAHEGWRVRVAVRRPNEALFTRVYGAPGQVEPILCNIRDAASVRAAMEGADAVVNCVGILVPEGRNRFREVQAEGAATIARLASELGVAQLVHLSSIGSVEGAPSEYSRTKARGEAAVLEHFPSAAILRPSVIFGPEDQFFNRFAAMARLMPVIPLVGGGTRFQPVYVGDVAAAAKACLLHGHSGVHELGGPEVETFARLIERMLRIIKRDRLVLSIPAPLGWPMAATLDILSGLTGGFVVNRILTLDQLSNLGRDNIVAADARGLGDLGVEATPLDAILPEYLWRFRPDGQYEEIKASAKQMREKH